MTPTVKFDTDSDAFSPNPIPELGPHPAGQEKVANSEKRLAKYIAADDAFDI